MLDLKFIRENPDLIKKAAKDKRSDIDIDRVLELDREHRQILAQLEQIQAERNAISKAIPKAPPAEQEQLKAKVAAQKPLMDSLNEKVKATKDDLDALLQRVPAPARSDVPIGKDDTENVEIKKWGTPRQFHFTPKDHMALGHALRIIDTERGVKIAGSRSYFLRGDGARLETAILQFTLDHLHKKGYEQLSVPVLVKDHAMVGTGYFPAGREQAYYVEEDKMALVGTSEVPMASYYSNEILNLNQLPVRFMAQSPCFRREAGTYGKDTHGLYRVHQFYKVEQVIICEADEKESEKLHAELLQNAEELLQALGLAYRVVYVCTGDLGQGQVRKHDIETWMPSRKAYSETHSCSTFHDFQARRLGIRYKNKDGQNTICHTLNNTAIATPRVLIPLLEVNQNPDGSINIPECLWPYMAGQKKIEAPK